MSVIIVGGGVAGFQAARACLSQAPGRKVTIIDKEPWTGYLRTCLPQFMAGKMPWEKLFYFQEKLPPQMEIRVNTRVVGIDRRQGQVLLACGEKVPYERLILAHGGEPYLPELIAKTPGRGIFTLRDLVQARLIKDRLMTHRRVIILGGSLVGVKTAASLRQAGLDVTMIVRRGSILLRALSAEAARLVQQHLVNMGIAIITDAPLEDLQIKKGDFAAIKAGGRWIEGDTLLVAAGIEPEVGYLGESGLLTDGELVVPPTLMTRDERIAAAGDAVTLALSGGKFQPNTWPQAACQGRLAGENIWRSQPFTHRDPTAVNAMDLNGLSLVILGPPLAGAAVVSHYLPRAGIFRELFHRRGLLVGGALLGDISQAGFLRALIAAETRLDPADMEKYAAGKVRLFRPRSFPAHYLEVQHAY
jgi:NAD(P)H-nitrite reductase large subunit